MRKSLDDTHTGQARKYQHAAKGANVTTTVKLSFLEAALGAEREFTASVRLHCPDCSGSGLSALVQPEDCAFCKGVGQILRFQHCQSGLISDASLPQAGFDAKNTELSYTSSHQSQYAEP